MVDTGRLDYNRLKVAVLEVLSKNAGMDGVSVGRTLAELNDIKIDIHALRMALMRYYKQGLLRRERSGGAFKYTISQRGVQRLRWLQQQAEVRD
jgi:DNA-binding transcriptional regulator PaaX